MKDFAGTPGTLTALVLRITQCVFAAGSIAFMASTSSFFNFTAFCYLIASMGLQVIWSFVLASLDACALLRKKVLHNSVLVSLFVVGDWVNLYRTFSSQTSLFELISGSCSNCNFQVTATLSLAAASASGGVAVLYFNDLGSCRPGDECQKYQTAVAFAFLSWISIAISSLVMLWLLAAG